MFNHFIKKASKELAKEITKSPQQREIEQIEKQFGVKMDPSSYKVFKNDAEFQRHLQQEQELENTIIDRLFDEASKIVNIVWDYQDDYMAKKIGKGLFTEKLEKGYDDLSREVVTARKIDPKGLVSPTVKFDIYNQHKKDLDYIKFTWLPKN